MKQLLLIIAMLIIVGCKPKPSISAGHAGYDTGINNNGYTVIIPVDTFKNSITIIDDVNLELMPGIGVADTFYFHDCGKKMVYSYSPIVESMDSLKK